MRATRLDQIDVNYLVGTRNKASRGHMYRLRLRREEAEVSRWNLGDIAKVLESLPQAYRTKSFEIWATQSTVSIVLWCPDKQSAKQLTNQFRSFNPQVQKEPVPRTFPSFKAGDYVRMGTLRPRRTPLYPIDYEFGRKGHNLVGSPVVKVLNSLGKIPDGSVVVIQVLWRRNRFNWQVYPWAHLNNKWYLPLGIDDDACKEKKEETLNFHADVRVLEIHSDKASARANMARHVGESFGVYRRQRSNELVFRHIRGPKARKRRFVLAMVNRNLAAFPQRGWRRARLSKYELAALVHPPPRGSRVIGAAYAPVRQDTLSTGQDLNQGRLEHIVQQLDEQGPRRPVHGSSGKKTASATQEALRLRRIGEGPQTTARERPGRKPPPGETP